MANARRPPSLESPVRRQVAAEGAILIFCCQPCQEGASCPLEDSLPAWKPSTAPSKLYAVRDSTGLVLDCGTAPSDHGGDIPLLAQTHSFSLSPTWPPRPLPKRPSVGTPPSTAASTGDGAIDTPRTRSAFRWQGDSAAPIHLRGRRVSTLICFSVDAMGYARQASVPVEFV